MLFFSKKKDTFIVLINVLNVCLSIGKSVSLGLSPISIAPLFLYCIFLFICINCTCLFLLLYFALRSSMFIFVIISLLKCISLLHVSLSISVHLKIYVLIAICIQLEFSNIDVPSLIITTALLCEHGRPQGGARGGTCPPWKFTDIGGPPRII